MSITISPVFKKVLVYCVCTLLITTSAVKAQNKIVTLKGQVKYYSSKTSACFFVDPQMVSAGVATGLGGKAGSACVDKKLGKGAPVNFDALQPQSDYPQPPMENVLIEAKGYWQVYTNDKKGKAYRFVVTQWEPFF